MLPYLLERDGDFDVNKLTNESHLDLGIVIMDSLIKQKEKEI